MSDRPIFNWSLNYFFFDFSKICPDHFEAFFKDFQKKNSFFPKNFFFHFFWAKLLVFGAKKFSEATVFLKKFFLIFFLKLDEKLHKMTEVLFLISIFYLAKK